MSRSVHAPFKSETARERWLAHEARRATAWPVPSEEQTVATSFGETFVRVSGHGDGAPVLLLPGIGSTGLSLAPVVAGLSGPLRTFVIDNIHDVGRSVESRPVTSADDFTTWLDEVRAGLGLEQPSVAGLSYGGWISAQYALRFPERVRRLVLLAPAGTTAPIPWGFIWRAILCAAPWRPFMRNFMRWVAPELASTPDGARRLEDMVDDGVLATRSFATRKMVPPLPLSDAQWQALRVPALFVAGDAEVIFPAREAVEKLARLAPQVERMLLPGAGHDFFLTRSGEVNARLLAFLARQ